MQRQAPNMSIQHACREHMSLRRVSREFIPLLQVTVVAYGAMMALAPGAGIATGPFCEEAVPIGVTELGTAASHVSSSWESSDLLEEYQEPACEAVREEGIVVKERRRLVSTEG